MGSRHSCVVDCDALVSGNDSWLDHHGARECRYGRQMIAVTESGSRYEFQWDADSKPTQNRYGTVSKNGGPNEVCCMLSDVQLGGRMVMALGTEEFSPVRRTTRVVEVFG
jgi:hypothetical protein